MTTALLAMPRPAAGADRQDLRGLRAWLVLVAGLIVVMVLVGGATRLTNSGLSITEWQPVTGVLPPLEDASWAAEFEKYRETPQYVLVNKGMSLAEFKSIYLWEWAHRLLGRLIGIVYLLPLLGFIGRGMVRGRLMWTLLAIGGLGALQGGVGWIMVASGLKPGLTAVAPAKLMLHLLFACGLLAAVLAVAVGLGARMPERLPRRVRLGAAALLAVVFVQIGLGALVAGLDAGLVYNTWPLMDGRLLPGAIALLPLTPWWANALATHATAQFDHRVGAYVLFGLAALHALDARRSAPATAAARRAAGLLLLVTGQATVGITALLLQVPIWAGLVHQTGAIAVLGMSVVHWRRMMPVANALAPRRGALPD